MPTTKTAKKNALKNVKKRRVNLIRKSTVKTAVKKVITALDSGELDKVEQLLKVAESELAQAKKKGVMHRNTAARKTSRLAKRAARLKRQKIEK